MHRFHTIAWASLILVCAASGGRAVAENLRPIPGPLVSTSTKQVYRFHFSGLQGADAVRLAEQLWPVVSKLPAENPVHRTILDAKDRASFLDDYRSLRNILLEAGVDTIYFLADEYWIESKTLPGTVAIAIDATAQGRLQRNLQAAGHDAWAAAIGNLKPAASAPNWLVLNIGTTAAGQPSPAKRKLVEHALGQSCPIRPATPHLGSLPALRIGLNEATPLTVVNLERNKLDAVLTLVLTALVPSSTRTAELSEKVAATTVTVATYPCPHVRQIAHLGGPGEATELAAEVQKQINGAVQRVVDLDYDLGPLLGLFAQSTIIISTQGSDVHMLMKPPALFDLQLASIKATEAQDLDWTALPPPSGYHWELIGSVGPVSRYDVLARARTVRSRGSSAAPVTPESGAAGLATFRVPFASSGLILHRNLKGQLKVELAAPTDKTPLPAVDLVDEQGRLAAVLRLDLGPGDPRYDLARTRAVLAKRLTAVLAEEKAAKKGVDDAENADQRAKLERGGPGRFDEFEAAQQKLRDKYRAHGYAAAAAQVVQELDDAAREQQRKNPAATLVKDSDSASAAKAAWAVDRAKFPFAGRWLFDYGVLTLYQDSSGVVAGVFASKVFYHTGKYEIDRSKPTSGLAILTGRAKGTKLKFTMFDDRSRERSGELTLNADGTGGTWKLDATEAPPGRNTALAKKNPLGLPPPVARPAKNAEGPRSGQLERVEVGPPDLAWTQHAPTSAIADYWVHASDKRMNTLLKAQPSGLLEGVRGSIPAPNGNLRAAVCGNRVLLIENVHIDGLTGSVHEADLSADGANLTYLGEGRGQALVLTRDGGK
ncbi:MAG: hypothetical protein SFU86_24925 [Pirellulaceae bacterium]|nr:hypothetical protein [Pirellulaceae bacterium]